MLRFNPSQARQGILLVADEIWADWILPAAAPREDGDGTCHAHAAHIPRITMCTHHAGAPGKEWVHFVPCSAVAANEGCALITMGTPFSPAARKLRLPTRSVAAAPHRPAPSRTVPPRTTLG